jgi:hypothetical protein
MAKKLGIGAFFLLPAFFFFLLSYWLIDILVKAH